jgi:hypothetical protein
MATQREPTMLTRRSWLQGSALIALYAWAVTDARAAVPALGGLHTDAIVIDAGLREASVLARGAQSQARVEIMNDDVAELFYGRLSPVWCEHGVRGLAGLTRASALFLLEPFVGEFGLRTVALERAPSAGCRALASLCESPARHPVSPEPMEQALLEQDHVAFAWLMAPVRRPLRAGVRIIST